MKKLYQKNARSHGRFFVEKRRKILLKKFSPKLFHFSKKYVMIKYNLIGESYGGKNFL